MNWNKLNPIWWFLNSDDINPPIEYMPMSEWRHLFWLCRNPLHNFTFYVIGVADKDCPRYGHYKEHVFRPGGGWNFAVTQYKIIPLPFISYKGKVKFYFGWREKGNFGIKFTKC